MTSSMSARPDQSEPVKWFRVCTATVAVRSAESLSNETKEETYSQRKASDPIQSDPGASCRPTGRYHPRRTERSTKPAIAVERSTAKAGGDKEQVIIYVHDKHKRALTEEGNQRVNLKTNAP
jgi:hypothetical protein